MLELPETLTLARLLNENVAGQTVARVLPPTKPHKFCWFTGDPAAYDEKLRGKRIQSASGFGIYAELALEGGDYLSVNDGVNVRLLAEKPDSYQLCMELSDGRALAFSVAMYGSVLLTDGNPEDDYYQKSKRAPLPASPAFEKRFWEEIERGKPTLSMKALLATEQRFPGIGNGVCQDILLRAGLNPKRKLKTLSRADAERLLGSARTVLNQMIRQGGRDTEKNLFGEPGGYQTLLSKNASLCPLCHGPVIKETYLGGSVYYCPRCQPV